jgi:hypothetical protein
MPVLGCETNFITVETIKKKFQINKKKHREWIVKMPFSVLHFFTEFCDEHY